MIPNLLSTYQDIVFIDDKEESIGQREDFVSMDRVQEWKCYYRPVEGHSIQSKEAFQDDLG